MLGIGVLTLYPLYFIVITAFKTREEYLDNQFLPPSDPTLQNFHDAFRDGELLRWVANSAGHHHRQRGCRRGRRRRSPPTRWRACASPGGCRSSHSTSC